MVRKEGGGKVVEVDREEGGREIRTHDAALFLNARGLQQGVLRAVRSGSSTDDRGPDGPIRRSDGEDGGKHAEGHGYASRGGAPRDV